MMTTTLPIVVYYLYFACNKESCSPLVLDVPYSWNAFFDFNVFLVTLVWIAFQALFYVLFPSKVVPGLPLIDGTKLKYNMNGLAACVVSTGGALLLHLNGTINLAYIYDHYAHFITATAIVSYVLSIYLYSSSFSGNKILAVGGNTGVAIYDFFIGRELNPRIGSLDLKFFCELRPGLIGWNLVNLGLAAKQYELHGELTNSMVLIVLFQMWYVVDAFTSESALLSTMDIIQDGFGFMLAFGDLCWVPFVYSLQARYLVDHPSSLSLLWVTVILMTKFLGFTIFRGANGQKDQFKRDSSDPSVAHLKFIKTETGSKLLADGWWGIARHINYLGDLFMALSWCLTTGFGSILTYFYVIYFAILLIHRERRDDHKCAKKYGKSWEEYCKAVPSRIIPYVY